MDIQTEVVSLSLVASTAADLRALAVSQNASIHNLANRLLRQAIAIEARRAETPKSGPVHESAGPEDIAQ